MDATWNDKMRREKGSTADDGQQRKRWLIVMKEKDMYEVESHSTI